MTIAEGRKDVVAVVLLAAFRLNTEGLIFERVGIEFFFYIFIFFAFGLCLVW